MATYNGERFILEQLTSIASQTVLPDEVIVCDDLSTDGTAEIVTSFARTAPFPLRFQINPMRLGYRKNFVEAASACRGELISFCDQDDIWEPTKVADTINFFSNSDKLLAAHDFSVFFPEGDRPEIPSYFDFLRMSGFSKVVSIKGCTLTMCKALIERVGWPPENVRDYWGHDNWVCFVANLLETEGFIDKPLIRHRIHGGNVSRTIAGGRDRVRAALRSLYIPPFTSRKPLDAFVSYYLRAEDGDLFRDAIRQCTTALTRRQVHQATSACERRAIFLRFPDRPAYRSTLPRAVRALILFINGVYRSGDGALGMVQDLYGDRKGRI